MNNVSDVVNGSVNVIFAPLMLILYKLLVVWPNQIIYWFLDIIQKLTGFSNDGLNTNLLAVDSPFMKVFAVMSSVGVMIGIVAFIIGYIKIITNKQSDAKVQIVALVKRSIYAATISVVLPIAFYVLSIVISTLFGSAFNNLIDIKSGSRANNQSDYQVIINALAKSNESSYVLMNKLLIFNTWTVGYSGEFVRNGEISPSLLPIIRSINNLSANNLFNGDGLDLLKASDLNKWNIVLSGLLSLVFLYGIISFVVSVIAKLLQVYVLMVLAPVILAGGVAMEKNTAKFTVDFIQKLIISHASILGYFLFSIIYVIITTVLNTKVSVFSQTYGSISNRMIQFAFLFAGITLINQIPVMLLKYFNSNEQVISNDLQEARSQFAKVSAPLQSAMTSVIGASVVHARSVGRATSNSLGEMRLDMPRTLK